MTQIETQLCLGFFPTLDLDESVLRVDEEESIMSLFFTAVEIVRYFRIKLKSNDLLSEGMWDLLDRVAAFLVCLFSKDLQFVDVVTFSVLVS